METKKSTINFDSIDVENNKYKEVKLNELLSKQLKKDLNIKWTYNSTGIEGNSYTLNQTRILLAEGITIGGKRLVEHLEIIGHSEAIEYLEDIIENNVELTEREIKNIHSLVTKDICCLYKRIKTYPTTAIFGLRKNGRINALVQQ